MGGSGTTKSFKILSLDGGGTWSLIQVKALIDSFGRNICGWDVLRYYDLVAANSGGSIVLAGLIQNMQLCEIENLFLNEGKRKEIFARTDICRAPLSTLIRNKTCIDFGAKYNTEKKLSGLRDVLSNAGSGSKDFLCKPLSEIPDNIPKNQNGRTTLFLIVAFDYDLNRAVFFRSDQKSLAGGGTSASLADITLLEAVHASSTAPVNYFDRPVAVRERRLWDGAIGGYNNPVLAAVVEAVANGSRYGIFPENIAVLSLGTGTVVLPPHGVYPAKYRILVQHEDAPSLLHDTQKLAGSILDDPPDSASFHAYLLMRETLPTPSPANCQAPHGDIRLIRMNPLVQPVEMNNKWIPPANISKEDFRRLVVLEMDAMDPKNVALIENFADEWIKDNVRNQPLRANRITLKVEIGHQWYSCARNRARYLNLIP